MYAGRVACCPKLDYCNYLYYKLPKSQLSRLQQIQNSLACTVVKAPKSCHITPILRSLRWLRINERIEYKLLSQVLTITQPPYLHILISVNVLVVLALHPSLLLLGHIHYPLLKLPIAHFAMLHRASGINSLYLFVNLILVPVPPLPTHLFLHPSLLPLLIHHSVHL